MARIGRGWAWLGAALAVAPLRAQDPVPSLEGLNRALLAARERLRPSLFRLTVTLSEESSRVATGIVVRQGLVVTSAAAVEGARFIQGDLEEEPELSVALDHLGEAHGVAVLSASFAGLEKARPVARSTTRSLPPGSLVLFLDGGAPGRSGVALPAALVPLAPGREPQPPLLVLKGLSLRPEDQGGLVCDASLKMVGLLAGGAEPYRVSLGRSGPAATRPAAPGPGRLERVVVEFRAARWGLPAVIPVERVQAAVEAVLARPAPPAPPPWPFLGILVDFPADSPPVVDRIFVGSPAHRAGVRQGDCLTHLNRQSVKTRDDLRRLLRQAARPGGSVGLSLVRAGRSFEVQATFATD